MFISVMQPRLIFWDLYGDQDWKTWGQDRDHDQWRSYGLRKYPDQGYDATTVLNLASCNVDGNHGTKLRTYVSINSNENVHPTYMTNAVT